MSHLDPSVETQLKVDASPFGLGVVQSEGSGDDLRPVAYVSRTFTDAERRYSQTEREALAVVWACERFHIYLYGQEFKLYTNHKALEVIYSPRSKRGSKDGLFVSSHTNSPYTTCLGNRILEMFYPGLH